MNAAATMADSKLDSDLEEEPIEHKDYERLLGEHASQKHHGFHLNDTKSGHRKLLILLCLGLLLNLSWTSFLFWKTLHLPPAHSTKNPSLPKHPDLIYSPARDVVEYLAVNSNITIDASNIFMGKPRPEQTLAWENITKWRNIAVSKEDLDIINRTSIELADGSGYMATLEVFHHVHCLDFIRMYIFRDYYDTHENEDLRWKHVDHCIEVLRQSVMCHADISLLTWKWADVQEPPFADFHIKHECRNWDNILEWTKQHQAAEEAIVRPDSEPYHPHSEDKSAE